MAQDQMHQDEVPEAGINTNGEVPEVVESGANNMDCREQQQQLFSAGDSKDVAIRSIVRSAVGKQIQLMQDLMSELNQKFHMSQETIDMM